MIELIMVIVVLGIMASIAMPRLERDLRQESGDNILSAIRYTQHMALMDNKANINESPAENWQKALWQIRFASTNGEWYYVVGSNSDYSNNIDQSEAAIDPVNGKYMHSSDEIIDSDESPNIFLTRKYSIKNVDFSSCVGQTGSAGNAAATVHHIAFDYLGRPHRGVFGATYVLSTLLHADCTLKFEFKDGSDDLLILIRKDTGYANIVDQNAS